MILAGDCRETLKTLATESIDSIVTDPPYEIRFMNQSWDGSGVANDPALWAECYRVLKPGGHVLAFGAARTYHRMACAIEHAGFEVRDSLHWVYGSGLPKSYNVSKGIDKLAGSEGEVVGVTVEDAQVEPTRCFSVSGLRTTPTKAATQDAKRWEGWGTALKPAHEPIVLARKPLVGTVVSNVLAHGTGALNIDGSRTVTDGGSGVSTRVLGDNLNGEWAKPVEGMGRWPANVILTHSTECESECAPDCPASELDRQSGQSKSSKGKLADRRKGKSRVFGHPARLFARPDAGYNDSGGASRFFAQHAWTPGDYLTSIYIYKAGKRERNAGVEKLPEKREHDVRQDGKSGEENPHKWIDAPGQNYHPTVKPVNLIRYLIKLVTPPGGLVLDPFLGSGTAAVAAILDGFEWIGCELTSEYLPIIEGRCQWARENIERPEPTLFDEETE